MKTQVGQRFDFKIYIGSREGYDGPYCSVGCKKHIQKYQQSCDKPISVRVAHCTYITPTYQEEGYEISAINYLRVPYPPETVEIFICGLAKYLLREFKQNRVTVETPMSTILYTADDADEHPDTA